MNPPQGETFYRIDVAAKIRDVSLVSTDRWEGYFYPAIEHHRSTEDVERIKKTSVAANFQFDTDGPASMGWLIDAKLGLTRDSINDKKTRTYSLMAALDGDQPPAPGGLFRRGPDRNFWFAYTASFGFERFEKFALVRGSGANQVRLADSIDESFMTVRVGTTFAPFAIKLEEQLELKLLYTARDRLSSNHVLPSTLPLWEVSLDYYLDAERRLAIGLSYQQGRDPKRNFLDEESSELAFKFRL